MTELYSYSYTGDEIIKMCRDAIKFDYGIIYGVGDYDACYKRVDAENLERTLHDLFLDGAYNVTIRALERKNND